MKFIYKSYIFLALLIPLLSTVITFNDQYEDKIDAALWKEIQSGAGELEYLVILNQKVSLPNLNGKTKKEKARLVYAQLKQHAAISQKEILTFLKSTQTSHRPYYIVNAIWVRSDAEILIELAKRNDVLSINANPWIKMETPEEETGSLQLRSVDPEWGILKIKADSVWDRGFRGQGVVVGGQDTGYDWEVSPLIWQYRGNNRIEADHNFNWHDAIRETNPMHPDSTINPCGLDVKSPCDDHNHGTHTMGTMVGEDDNNKIGVAPEAKWIGCRNMDRGYGKPSTYIECFEWFLAPYDLNGENADPDKAPHVINNSWACPEKEGCNASNWHIMQQVVENLKASGIFVVVSAGNSGNQGCGSVDTPAAMFEASFTVGSTRMNDTISGFSSRGPVLVDSSYRLKPDVVAPGQGVYSVIRGGAYATFSGTSMAGPHVAGLVALLISANPALAGEVHVLENIIKSSSLPIMSEEDCGGFSGLEIPNTTYGHGRVDALQALNLALDFVQSTKDEISSINIEVFPNPAMDNISFKLTDKNYTVKILKIEMSDISGKQTKQFILNTQDAGVSLPLDHLPYGLLMYRVYTSVGIYTGKFVKI